MIILEATEVELEFEGEPDEGPNTVQAHVVVAGPRGGKRKRKGWRSGDQVISDQVARTFPPPREADRGWETERTCRFRCMYFSFSSVP